MGCFFIFGFPQEVFGDVLTTYWAIAKCALRGFATVNVNVFFPQPNTKLYRESVSERKIRLDEEYFYSLFTTQDALRKKKSWNPKIGERMLTCLVPFGYALFFGLSLLFRPWRHVATINGLFHECSTSKLGSSLRGMLFDYRRVVRSLFLRGAGRAGGRLGRGLRSRADGR